MSRKIADQVGALEKGVREVDRTNPDVRIEQNGKDELDMLAGAFNRMASELQKSENEPEMNVAGLRENELRLRLVVRASHEMIWEADESGDSEWSDTL